MNQTPLDSSASSESQEDEPAGTMEVETDTPAEPSTSTRETKDEKYIKDFVKSVTRDQLEIVAMELLRRQPDFLVDIMDDSNTKINQPQQSGPSTSPPWCKCGFSCPMPMETENKCCCYGAKRCVMQTDAFQDICLNTNVLGVDMRVREDKLVNEEDQSNKNYRHYAYRGYVYWRFGRVGRGNRLVIPLCCVLKIRE